MKKFILFTISFLIISGLSAQKKNRTSAKLAFDNKEYAKAKQYIDLAVAHEDTKADAKTWYYRLLIYNTILNSKDENVTKVAPNASEEVYKSLQNLNRYDTKNSYANEKKGIVGGLYNTSIQAGISAFNKQKYPEAYKYFEKSQEYGALYGIVDSIGIYNGALAAELNKDYDNAVKGYERSIAIDYQTATSYSRLIGIYNEKGENERAMKTIKEAAAKFPDNYEILISQINMFKDNGENDKALIAVEKAISQNNNDKLLFMIAGQLYEKTGDIDKAVESYENALSIDPNYSNAVFNLGVIYFNQSNDVIAQIQSAGDDATKTKFENERTKLLNKALPYLEKSYQNEGNKSLIPALNVAYTVLGMEDKVIPVEENVEE